MKRPSLRVLQKHLRYDPGTGEFWWLLTNVSGRPRDKPAGSFTGEGYRRIKFFCVPYGAHRLAWVFMTGKWATKQIDHKDGDPGNNRWNNLRLASPSQNKQNSKLYSRNTSGFKGVSFHKQTKKWMANCRVNSKLLFLGLHSTPAEAHVAYCKAAKKYFGEFARF